MNRRTVGFFTVAWALSSCQNTPDEHDHAAEWVHVYSQGAYDECSGMTTPDESGFNKKVALTFDDGPNPNTTPELLDILSKRNIQATFFIVGANASTKEGLEIVVRERNEGHLVANHTMNHQNSWYLTDTEFAEQVEGAQAILAKVQEPKYFRFPYGAADCTTTETVRLYGYHVTGWDNDSGDWCFAHDDGYCSPSTWDDGVPDEWRNDMVGYTLSQIKQNNGGIVLFHDIHQYTVDNIETVIDELEAGGFSFVRVDDVNTFPKLNEVKDSWIGHTCSTDADCNFDASAFCMEFGPQDNGARGFCSMPCEGYCDDKEDDFQTFCADLGSAGYCVAKQSDETMDCAGIWGTIPTSVSRFVGSSGANAATATTCLGWEPVETKGVLSANQESEVVLPTLPPGQYGIAVHNTRYDSTGNLNVYVALDDTPSSSHADYSSTGSASNEVLDVSLEYAREIHVLLDCTGGQECPYRIQIWQKSLDGL